MVNERSIARLIFERNLREKLAAAGVQAVPEFRIKRGSNSPLLVDFFISSPQRAVVEVVDRKSFTGGVDRRKIHRAHTKLDAVRQDFDGQIICFLIIINHDAERLETPSEDDWLITINVSWEAAEVEAASAIHDRLYGSLPADRLAMFSDEALLDDLPETGVLSDVLVSFRTRIADEAFQILKLEAENFFREYSSEHYTTSALCVGRMLEFIVYTLAKAWRVPINKRTIKLLDDLEGRFSLLSKSIVDYTYAENDNEKKKLKIKLNKDVIAFSTSVSTATLFLHLDHERIDTDYPVNIQSILRDIRKRHSKISTVRKEIELLLKGDLIGNVLKMRNRAAHADTSGSRTEYEKHDIDSMLEDLRAILFHLGNIADAVDREAY